MRVKECYWLNLSIQWLISITFVKRFNENDVFLQWYSLIWVYNTLRQRIISWNTAFIKINTTVAFKEGLINMYKIIFFNAFGISKLCTQPWSHGLQEAFFLLYKHSTFINVPRNTKRGNRGAFLCWLFGISPIRAENTINRVEFISRSLVWMLPTDTPNYISFYEFYISVLRGLVWLIWLGRFKIR